MEVKIDKTWKKVLDSEFGKPYFIKLTEFVKSEYQTGRVFPPPKLIFSAFDNCPFDKVKVVIIGQDPYHGAGQANGLAFSVASNITIPPSLQNIFKEIQDDLGRPMPKTGNLSAWAKQGVLLLNATLTVRANQAGSHQNRDWEQLTDAVIKILSDHKSHLVFLLWGAYARRKKELIDTSKHLVLEAAHPSPLSAYSGFFGCKHFSQTNEYLKNNGIEVIDW